MCEVSELNINLNTYCRMWHYMNRKGNLKSVMRITYLKKYKGACTKSIFFCKIPHLTCLHDFYVVI